MTEWIIEAYLTVKSSMKKNIVVTTVDFGPNAFLLQSAYVFNDASLNMNLARILAVYVSC